MFSDYLLDPDISPDTCLGSTSVNIMISKYFFIKNLKSENLSRLSYNVPKKITVVSFH